MTLFCLYLFNWLPAKTCKRIMLTFTEYEESMSRLECWKKRMPSFPRHSARETDGCKVNR